MRPEQPKAMSEQVVQSAVDAPSENDLREVKDLVRANEELRTLIKALERHSRVQQAFFDLSKEFSLELREADLVSLAARTLSELCPERYFAIRIINPQTGETSAAVVEGPLALALGGPIVLKRT